MIHLLFFFFLTLTGVYKNIYRRRGCTTAHDKFSVNVYLRLQAFTLFLLQFNGFMSICINSNNLTNISPSFLSTIIPLQSISENKYFQCFDTIVNVI